MIMSDTRATNTDGAGDVSLESQQSTIKPAPGVYIPEPLRPLPLPPQPALSSSGSTSGTVIEELDLKFGRAKTKQDIISILEHCTILHRIPLPPPNVGTEQAYKDFARERVLLNDVAFIPDKNDIDRSHAFALTLKILLQRCMRCSDAYDAALYPRPEAISDLLLQRACRTSAGADSFFFVQKMLCMEGTFVTQKVSTTSRYTIPTYHLISFLHIQPH
jgi:hypothetical protein